MKVSFRLRMLLAGIGLCILLAPLSACFGSGGHGQETPPADGSETPAASDKESPTDAQGTQTEEETEAVTKPKKEIKVRTDAVGDVSFTSLPLGSVSAESWLRNQLVLLAENAARDFEKLSPDCLSEGGNRSGWLGGSGESWERGTYYVRGLVSLAYELNDEGLKAQAQKWIDWTLGSQTECGTFGPYADTPDKVDYWPLMPMLIALESYCDATGDGRVIPFLEKYFAWEAQSLAARPLSDWSSARGGDNILAVYWLYQRTHDESLLDLCRTLYEQTDNWAAAYDTDAWAGVYHIVNVHESFKLFPLMYAVTGDGKYLDVYYRGIDNLYMASGRADGMSNGDELTRGISAVFGTETCAVVERMLSDEIALVLLHDAKLADRLELLAYNTLPQQLLPDGKGQVYFTMQNQIAATLGNHGFTSDGGDRSVYGMPGGFPCCAHNYVMGWPLFAASMWMQTGDGGLAVGAYGPCSVTATVGEGTRVTLTQITDYPFRDNITLKLQADRKDTFPLCLRVPEWCAPEDVSVSVNGHAVTADWQSGAYFVLSAEWEDGDEISLTFPSRIRLELNENNSVSVKKGAVLYALSLNESWAKVSHNPNNWNLNAGSRYSSYNITTKDTWNAALSSLSLKDPGSAFTVSEAALRSDTRFTQDDAPVVLTAEAVLVPGWTLNDAAGTAGLLPPSPLTAEKVSGEAFTVRLIPYGFTRLRIAAIPWCGEGEISYTARDTGESCLFENVIMTTDRTHKPGEGEWKEVCVLHLDLQMPADGAFEVIVNRRPCGTIQCSAGENHLTLPASPMSAGYRNRVELIPLGERPASLHLTLSSERGDTLVYQAVEGSILGAAENRGTYVGGIDRTGDGVLLPAVTLPASGTYKIRVFHCSAMGDALQTLSVNEKQIGSLVFKKTGDSWGSFDSTHFAELTVELPAGTYAVKLRKPAADAGFAEIRTIEFELVEAHDAEPFEGASLPICRVEAESGVILGKCYSTGTHVAGIDNVGDGVRISVDVPQAGEYVIRVHHSGPMGKATHTVLIDGQEVGKISYPGTSTGWGQFTDTNYGELTVSLPAGTRTLTLIRRADDTGFAEVDAVTLFKN